MSAQQEPLLRLESVRKQFAGLRATNDVSLTVDRGKICSLIGPNGAGKSTILNLITGYIRASSGTIRIDGARTDRMSSQRIAEMGVARAFQISRPFHSLSVAENVRVGALFGRLGRRDVDAVTGAALELCGLVEQRDRQASELTVGYLRRLELARAVAARPLLLLADEPCAGLNHTETAEMVGILRRIRDAGATILFIEHDMSAVMSISDRIFAIDAGTLIAEGSPEEVANNPRVIEAYLGAAPTAERSHG